MYVSLSPKHFVKKIRKVSLIWFLIHNVVGSDPKIRAARRDGIRWHFLS